MGPGGQAPAEVLRELGELGFLGMTIAPEWGGVGTDYVAYALALMEIAAGDGSISTVMSVQNAPVCAVLAGYGNESQKERWLRPLASGHDDRRLCADRARSRLGCRQPEDPRRPSRRLTMCWMEPSNSSPAPRLPGW